ncbi:MAG: hypothetical protein II968_01170 [Selenomonadaceae bacterium]|nr:hypothetical protein [Selenomonadaceae bacterium]
MKKLLKSLKEFFAPVDKVFLVGFTLLTIATFDLSFRWCLVTIAGFGFIFWQWSDKNAQRR